MRRNLEGIEYGYLRSNNLSLKYRWITPLVCKISEFRNNPVALDLSKGIQCGVPSDLTGSCSAKRSLHNKVRINLLVLLPSSIYKIYQ